MQHKAFSPNVKAMTGDGTVSVVMATLNEIDSDGDVTEPGFFGRQTAQIVPTHDWAHVPLGKAHIREVGNEAIAELQFNLDVPAAADWYKAIRYDFENPPALQEYSYGFDILPGGSRYGQHKGQPVRFLQPLPNGRPGVRVVEVSPVMRGAGVGTRTLAVKQAGDGLDPHTRGWLRRLAEKNEHEQAATVLAKSRELLNRMEQWAVLVDAERQLITSWYVELAPIEVPEWKRVIAETALARHAHELGHTPLPDLRWFRAEETAERHYLELYGEPARIGWGWTGEGKLLGRAYPPDNQVWLNAAMHHAADIDAITGHEVCHLTGGDEPAAQAYEAKARDGFWDTEGLK